MVWDWLLTVMPKPRAMCTEAQGLQSPSWLGGMGQLWGSSSQREQCKMERAWLDNGAQHLALRAGLPSPISSHTA